MHDDQWGAATVTLAACINALKLTGNTKENVKVVMNGIGAAGVATARLLLVYGIKNIIFCDSKGIIHEGMEGLNKEKKELLAASNLKPEAGSLVDAIVGANIFIGLSVGGALSQDMVRTMADMPIIFGLANPFPEIMPDEAKTAGAYIIATGRSDFPNQINNSLVFPGAFKGMLEANIPQFKIEMFSAIAQAIADYVTDISPEKIIPSMFDKGVVELVSNTIQKFK